MTGYYNNMSLLSEAFPDYRPLVSSSAVTCLPSFPVHRHPDALSGTGSESGTGTGSPLLFPACRHQVTPHIACPSFSPQVNNRLERSQVVDQINKYALSIEYTDNLVDSIVVSPYSLFSILFPLYVASKGETRLELGRYLKLNDSSCETANSRTLLNTIIDTTKLLNDAAFCKYVNILYMNPKYRVSSKFTKLFESYFKFESGVDSSKIDSFVNQFTNGLIPKMGVTVNKDTVAVLLNVIYLKTEWLHAFKREMTMPVVFRGLHNTTSKIMLMHDTRTYLYGEDNDRQIVYIPYKTNNYGMLVVLPKSRYITKELLNVNMGQMQGRLVDLYLPRFDLSTNLDNNYFHKNGLKRIFQSSCNEINIADKPVYVSSLIHKIVVKVDENGTEAAATTAALMNLSSCLEPSEPEQPILFRADHTFMFAIVKRAGLRYLPIFTGFYTGST